MRSSTELFELGPRQLHQKMARPGGVGGDEGQVDLGLHGGGELDLGLLRGFLEALDGHLVLGQVDAGFPAELLHDPVLDALVEIVAAEVRVAVGGLDLDDALADLEDGDVEGAAAEVVDGDRLVLLLVHAVGQGRGRRLVDDALDLEPGDLARVLGGLALTVVEIGRDGDDGPVDLLTEIVLGGLFQLLEDEGRDLGRSVHLAVGLDAHVAVRSIGHLERDLLDLLADLAVAPAHEPLDRIDGVFGIRHPLPLGHLADQDFAFGSESDDRRSRPATLFVGDDGRLFAFLDGHDGIRRAEIDADYL